MPMTDTILLAVQSAEERSMLRKIFEDRFHILEAENGQQAMLLLEQNCAFIAAVLLDMDIPLKKGEEIMAEAREKGILPRVAFLAIIHRRDIAEEYRAFEWGAHDVLVRPLHAAVVDRRVQTTVSLVHSNRRLEEEVREQREALLRANETMVDTLSSIIEHRSMESGQHVLRIRRFTRILLEELARVCPEYNLDEETIRSIASAAALHDVGKISIPDRILNKPGRLSDEEYEVMKGHTTAGCAILESLVGVGDESYLRYAYNICRWHHERWDGGGYPDGLRGEEIPVCAQAVGLADVYDALTSDRVYKSACSSSEAVNMILGGECGVFSPQLLECLKHVQGEFRELARAYADGYSPAADAITAPLAPPDRVEASTLQTALAKYQALIHHMDATVVEVDLDHGTYHIIFNPNPEFSALHAGENFEDAMFQVAHKALHPEDRHLVVDQMEAYLDDFFDSGLRQRVRSYRLQGEDGDYRTFEATILRVNTRDGSRSALAIWKPVNQDGTPMDTISHGMEEACKGALGIMQSCIYDRWLTMEQVNRGLAELLGYSGTEIAERFGKRLMELVIPEKRGDVLESFREQYAAENRAAVEIPMYRKDGTLVWLLCSGILIREKDGVERIYSLLTDISEAKQTQLELRRTLERQQLILDSGPVINFEWDFASDRMTWSSQFEEEFGYDPVSIKATERMEAFSHIHPDDVPLVMERMEKLRTESVSVETMIRVVRSDGRYGWYRFRAVSQDNTAGVPEKAFGILSAADENGVPPRGSRYITRDGLTDLLDRNSGRRLVEQRLGGEELSALAIIDLDYFKEINDRYGHLLGDEVLTMVATEIRGKFRDGDVIARVGGDEFMVFMSGIPNRELMETRCRQLISSVEEMYRESLADSRLSCCVGVAYAPEHGTAYQELFQRADRALYQAKSRGSGQCVSYSAKDIFDQAKSGINRRIESNERPGTAQNRLVYHVFERLYESGDVETTIGDLLAIVGQAMNVSRVYIFENDYEDRTCSNTFEWCNEGISPEKDGLQDISYETDIPRYWEQFNERGIFYCPDVERLPKHLRDILEPQGVRSLLQCAIRDGGRFRGYVGFDDNHSARLWTQEQIDLLTFLAQVMSVFLLKYRVQCRTDALVEDLRAVLDNQYAWSYVVEPESYRLLFFNGRTREAVPDLAVGDLCHKVLMGMDEPCRDCPIRQGSGGSSRVKNDHLNLCVLARADSIWWDDKAAWLVTCREETET